MGWGISNLGPLLAVWFVLEQQPGLHMGVVRGGGWEGGRVQSERILLAVEFVLDQQLGLHVGELNLKFEVLPQARQ